MSVQRWYANDEMTASKRGPWVYYDDHEAALAEMRVNCGVHDQMAADAARADAIRECVAAVEAQKPDIRGQLDEYDSGYRDASKDTYAFHLRILRALLPEADA